MTMTTAYFIHNNAYDSIVIPETKAVLTANSGDEWMADYLKDFLDDEPNFSSWIGNPLIDLDDLNLDDLGEVVATRAEEGNIEVVKLKIWEERLTFYGLA